MHKGWGKRTSKHEGLLEEVIVGKSKEVIGEINILNLLQTCRTQTKNRQQRVRIRKGIYKKMGGTEIRVIP